MPAQRSYMPPQVQRQMEQTLQRTLPADLKKYASGNTYIPQHAREAIAQHMEKTMPAHLREYSGEFMRQQTISGAQTIRPTQPQPVTHPTPPPVPNRMRRDHSLGFGQQYSVDLDNPSDMAHQDTFAYTQQYQAPSTDTLPVGTPTPTANGPGGQYDFIVNSNGRRSNNWLLTAPLKTRIMVVGGGFLVLLLLGWIFVALLTASSSVSQRNFVALAQQQAELARISDQPSRSATLGSTRNLASTARMSLLSDEQSFVGYLSSANAQPSPETLAQNRSTATDAQLASAKSDGTYDQVYTSLVQQQLAAYSSNLKRAFSAATNVRERQLLNAAYEHAQLLLALSKQS